MFGDADPVGRSLVAEGKSYTVSAVMRDIERSVIPPVDLLYRGDLLTKKNNNNESMSNVGSCCTFLLAREGADLRAKLPDMLDYFKTIYLPYIRDFYRQVTLLPLREVYFSPLDSYGNLSSGNRSFVTILMAIGIVILLFAVIDYVNLTAAQTGFRAKEMATRRLLGATKGEVVLKLILESTLMCCTAFAVAFLLAEAAEPYAARLFGAKIDISAAATPERIAWYALFLLALGFVSGIVPATLVARYKPVDVMRGSLRHRTKQVYSKVLIVIQNAITVAMLATSLTVYAQTRHLIDAPLGYDTKDILMLRHNIFDGYDQMRRLRDELRSEPSVEAVAFSNATPLTKGSNWTMQYDGGRMISFEYFVADSVFFRILGLELLRDNHTEGWGFNQYAFKQMDIPEDTPGVRLANIEDPVSVAGIYRDFRFGSVLEKPTAMILRNIGDFDRFWNGKKLSAPRFPGTCSSRRAETTTRLTPPSAAFSNESTTTDFSRGVISSSRSPTSSPTNSARCASWGSSRWLRSSSRRWGCWPCPPTTCSRNSRRRPYARSSERRGARCSDGWWATSWHRSPSRSSSPYRSHGTPSTAGCRITASASGSARGSSSQPAHSPRPSHWPPSSWQSSRAAAANPVDALKN